MTPAPQVTGTLSQQYRVRGSQPTGVRRPQLVGPPGSKGEHFLLAGES